MERFQNQLRERAQALDLSLAEVARRAGISERRIGHYASGRSEPDLRTLVRIADVMGTTPDGLLLPPESSVKATDERAKLTNQVLAGCSMLNANGLRLLSATALTFSMENMLRKKN